MRAVAAAAACSQLHRAAGTGLIMSQQKDVRECECEAMPGRRSAAASATTTCSVVRPLLAAREPGMPGKGAMVALQGQTAGTVSKIGSRSVQCEARG